MKKIISKKEFTKRRRNDALRMSKNKSLLKNALNLKIKAGHEYFWVHQTNWMDEPALQLPQDLFAFQEIIYKTKPKYIIEIGVAWGGTLLFNSTILKLCGGKGIIGIDIFIPNSLKQRLNKKIDKNIDLHLFSSSSLDPKIIKKVKKIIKNESTMVILDSFHTHDHVKKELDIYSQIVTKNCYIVCCDTVIELQPPVAKRPRPWKKGNSPMTAVKEFISENNKFKIDKELENKLLLSNMPNGYLKRVK